MYNAEKVLIRDGQPGRLKGSRLEARPQRGRRQEIEVAPQVRLRDVIQEQPPIAAIILRMWSPRHAPTSLP